MASIPPPIDTNRSLIELSQAMTEEMQRTGAPSAYFEELWYLMIKYLEDVDARLIAGGL